METFAALVAREYLRVSLDRRGGASVKRQHADNSEAADRNGWRLGEPYDDNDRRASRYSDNAREDFTRLVEDLEAGRFGAQILILWESSRGSRKVWEWVRLIDACEAAAVQIFVTSHRDGRGVLYDPADGHDRRTLLTDAVDAEYESSKISNRTKSENRQRAADGQPHGRCPFGYKRVYEFTTVEGKQVRTFRQLPDEDESPMVVQLFDLLLEGVSLNEIERRFKADGWVSRNGVPFSAQNLRGMALNPAYSGRRIHVPGRKGGRARMDEGTVTQGNWPALVPPEKFDRVQAKLRDPARQTSRPGRGKHLLSMIGKCAVCGSVIVVRATRKGDHLDYYCRERGCVRVDYDQLNQYATGAILGYLSRADVFDAMRESDAEASVELAAARAAVAAVRAELVELEAGVSAGRLSVAFAGKVEGGMRARLEAAEARERELQTPTQLRDLIEPGEGVARSWASLEMPAKREVARLLLSPAWIGELRVHTAAGKRWRHRELNEERVTFSQAA